MSITEQISNFITSVTQRPDMQRAVQMYIETLNFLKFSNPKQETVQPKLDEILPVVDEITSQFNQEVLSTLAVDSRTDKASKRARINSRLQEILTARIDQNEVTINIGTRQLEISGNMNTSINLSEAAIQVLTDNLVAPWQIFSGLASSVDKHAEYLKRKQIEGNITKKFKGSRFIHILKKLDAGQGNGLEIGDNGLSWLETPMFTSTFEGYLELRLLLLTLEQLSETENE